MRVAEHREKEVRLGFQHLKEGRKHCRDGRRRMSSIGSRNSGSGGGILVVTSSNAMLEVSHWNAGGESVCQQRHSGNGAKKGSTLSIQMWYCLV